MEKIITLTTDFGLTDEYVGVMKGVILARAPGAKIIDLTHGISYQDIRQAAYVIHSACGYFPAGTIHIIVVDPWVGSSRRIVLLSFKGQLFLAPDNGVLTLLLQQKELDAAYEVTCEELYLKPVSHTFHGRDIFSPVAAALINGMTPEDVGPSIDPNKLTVLTLPIVEVNQARGKIKGSVVRIDHFGNLMTNIHRDTCHELFSEDEKDSVLVVIKGQIIHGLQSSYSSVGTGSLLAIFSSRDYLEIALNLGNASEQLNANIGEEVTISFDKPILSLYKGTV